MLFELFVFGGFWFWTLTIGVLLWLFVATKYERSGQAFGAVVVFSLAMWLLGDFNVFKYVFENPIFVFSCFAGYLILGVAWAFWKWWWFNKALKEMYDDMKVTFFKKHNIAASDGTAKIPTDLRQAWLHYIKESSHWEDHKSEWTDYIPKGWQIQTVKDVVPAAKDFKETITFWISFWPISGIWAIVHDFIERVIHQLFMWVKGSFDRMAKRIWKVDEDLIEEMRDSDA